MNKEHEIELINSCINDLVYAEQNGKDWKIKTICKEELN